MYRYGQMNRYIDGEIYRQKNIYKICNLIDRYKAEYTD